MSERERIIEIIEQYLDEHLSSDYGIAEIAKCAYDALARAGLQITPQAGEAEPHAWVYEFDDPDPQTDIEFGAECPKGWKRHIARGAVYPLYRTAPPRPVGPIPMILFCPSCGLKHIDAPQPEKGWTNPPHRSHECQGCGLIWRPADIETTGVYNIQTRGKNDSAIMPTPSPVAPDRSALRGKLKQIGALAENPHWTTDRRWKIAQLAQDALALLPPDSPGEPPAAALVGRE